MTDKTLTTAEVAERLKMTTRQVTRLITGGTLPATKHGRDYVIKEEDLALVASRPKRGRPRKDAPKK